MIFFQGIPHLERVVRSMLGVLEVLKGIIAPEVKNLSLLGGLWYANLYFVEATLRLFLWLLSENADAGIAWAMWKCARVSR